MGSGFSLPQIATATLNHSTPEVAATTAGVYRKPVSVHSPASTTNRKPMSLAPTELAESEAESEAEPDNLPTIRPLMIRSTMMDAQKYSTQSRVMMRS